jgi:hypothetical protein
MLSRFVFLLAAAISIPLHAGVIYTYTGQPFNNIYDPYDVLGLTTDDSITATIELASALTPDEYIDSDTNAADFLAWSISAGGVTYDQDTGETFVFPLMLETDATGDVTSWILSVMPTSVSGGIPFSSDVLWLATAGGDLNGDIYTDEGTVYDTNFNELGSAEITDVEPVGTWSEGTAGTPEPGTLVLAALGGSMLAALRKRILFKTRS